jgi:hypothetical protein
MAEEQLRVPSYFPRANPECKKVAEVFFDCLSCNSAQPLGSKTWTRGKCKEQEGGKVSAEQNRPRIPDTRSCPIFMKEVSAQDCLNQCSQQLKLYESCMTKSVLKKPAPVFRVRVTPNIDALLV